LGELVKFEGEYAGLPFYNQLATPVEQDGGASANSASTEPPPSESTPVDISASDTPAPDLPYGTTLAQINVRSGPASSFESYGLMQANERVNILGQTLNGLWFQIEYASSPTGSAWVSSQYVRLMSDIRDLPYFNNDGSPVAGP
jgi:hypothetical protein